MYLFTISYALDQRSGDGWFSGWFDVFVNKRSSILKCSIGRLHQRWTESSIILTSKEESILRNKRPRSRTVSFVADRLLAVIYDHFRVTGIHDSVENYADLHCLSSKWWYSGIRLEMWWNFIVYDENPTWWHLGRIVQTENTRAWETQDRIGFVWPSENRTWFSKIEDNGQKRSIEKEIRNKNFGNRNGNFEKNAVVKNQGTKQRVQRILGDCWQWEFNGQSSKGDNCSFRHDTNKRGKVAPSNPSPNSFMQQNERKASRTRNPMTESQW